MSTNENLLFEAATVIDPNKDPYAPKLIDVLNERYENNIEQLEHRRRVQKDYRVKLNRAIKQMIADGEIEDTEEDRAEAIADYKRQHPLKLPYEQVCNLLVLGEPGGGKTSIITGWAKDKGIRLVTKTAGEIDEFAAKGAVSIDKIKDASTGEEETRAIQVRSEFFDQLDSDGPYTVFFADELGRSYKEVESALLTLFQDKTIADRSSEGGRKFFDKLLFTVAATNPPGYDPQATRSGGTKNTSQVNAEARALSNAMNTRFIVFYWNSDPDETKKFLDSHFDSLIKDDEDYLSNMSDSSYAAEFGAEGNDVDEVEVNSAIENNKLRKLVADTLLSSGNFRFADDEEIKESSKGDPHNIHVLNSRTLLTALKGWRNGVIGTDPSGNERYPAHSFMYLFKYTCSQNHNLLRKVEFMLKDLDDPNNINLQNGVKDINNNANSIKSSLLDIFNQWQETFGDEYK